MTGGTPEAGTEGEISVEVIYALPERREAVRLRLPTGASVRDAVLKSALDRSFPDLDLATAPIGVWGVAVADQRIALDGDRIEIYRPLAADPRERRRLLARLGQTMASKRGSR